MNDRAGKRNWCKQDKRHAATEHNKKKTQREENEEEKFPLFSCFIFAIEQHQYQWDGEDEKIVYKKQREIHTSTCHENDKGPLILRNIYAIFLYLSGWWKAISSENALDF